LPAVAAAKLLRRQAAMDRQVADGLLDLLADGDRLAAMLSLHALSAAPGRAAELALVTALEGPDLGEHAAWALARRAPVQAAIPALAGLVAHGGFAAMPAQLTLERWSDQAGERVGKEIRHALARCSTAGGWSRLVETLALVNAADAARSPGAAAPSRRNGRQGGLRIAQILLRGRVDAELGAAGSGDGGGVVTLLVQLARELGRRKDVTRSLIIAHDPPRRVVLQAPGRGFLSRDTITVEPAAHGSTVHYGAALAFSGLGRLLDPVMQLIFNRVGARAAIGMQKR
jgi:hypothetical protein